MISSNLWAINSGTVGASRRATLRELSAVWETNARLVENPRESVLAFSFPETNETKKTSGCRHLRNADLVNRPTKVTTRHGTTGRPAHPNA